MLNYDLMVLVGVIGSWICVIMVVNLLGNFNDFDVICDLIGNCCIVLIEDNCEFMGVSLNGRQVGIFGVMGMFLCFFLYYILIMEGGLVVIDDEELYYIMLVLCVYGWMCNLL